ncbi:CAAX protease self-immunity [Natronoarchaeum philippinense]|uniref:CAAX protease self-immunity n=1 Tax=Natronoarchaeum philippinense TaxID=558529 RepID=A0A285NZF9_NATPI|nr:CPBP family intramembrane glutamic endopeptidase [Natronoarchaeum philippinense]SNZ13021.1 CAAX protease self-immunity [Natronoarchaeum philippinense]
MTDVARTVRHRFESLTWVQRAFIGAAVLLLAYVRWSTPTLSARIVRDLVLLVAGPLALGLLHGRRVGWTVNRTALRDTVLLALFVLPFYVVGSSLPSIRTFYPLWETTLAPGEFLPHAIKLFALALATETYFRGLLCVGVRDIGPKAVFVSPVVYALLHSGKPPIELALSGPTDVLFGAVDYNSGSILPSVVAHGCGLVLLDWLVLRPPVFPPEAVLRWLSWVPIPL